MIAAVLRRRRSALLLAAGLLAGGGAAGRRRAGGRRRRAVDIEQRLGAPLPLDLAFVDAHGRSLRLADAFADRRPVLLVFGTYRCADLCGLAMHGVLEALDAGGLPRRDWRLLGVGLDPAETPADALARQTVYLAYAEHLRDGRAADAPPDLRLLVGAPAAVAALARQAGFGYLADAPAAARRRSMPPASSSSPPTAAPRATSPACASTPPSCGRRWSTPATAASARSPSGCCCCARTSTRPPAGTAAR